MWQPSPRQWSLIWTLAIVVVLAWPPGDPVQGQPPAHSLGVTLIRWLADPLGSLPTLPPPLPMAMDDDGDAVTAYDQQVQAYQQARERSAMNRWRMDLVNASDPFAPATQRQLLVALAVAGALIVWQMNTPRAAA